MRLPSSPYFACLMALCLMLGACSARADPGGQSGAPSADDVFDAYLEEDRQLEAELDALPADATLEILRQRTVRDQRVRTLMLDLLETPGAGPNEATLTWLRLMRHMSAIDRENANWLKTRLDEIDWFTRSEYGEQADNDAFLIVQHATHDPDFMRNIHQRFERLAQNGEIAPDNYALLTDRLAVMDGAPQPYGSQFECAEGEQRLQTPLSDPEPVVDARRAEVGLPPLAEYRAMLPDCSALPGGG